MKKLLLSVLLVVVLMFALFIAEIFDEVSNLRRARTIGAGFHLFNGHLKALCTQRTLRDECPRDENQLASFNPEMYVLLKKNTQVFYSFDRFSFKHTFSVKYRKNGVYVSHDDFYPGAGYMTTEEARDRYGIVFR